jgi:hypothetical protein
MGWMVTARSCAVAAQVLETPAVRREVEQLVQEEIQSRLRSMSSQELLQTLDGLKQLDGVAGGAGGFPGASKRSLVLNWTTQSGSSFDLYVCFHYACR